MATTDFKNVIKDTAVAALHGKTFAKCTQIWNGSRRPKASQEIHEIIGKQLTYPVVTRWNSLYDCVKELLKFEVSLNLLLSATKTKNHDLSPFTKRELAYLKEFMKLMEPISASLDYLQGDKHTYFGRLLPTIFTLKARLQILNGEAFAITGSAIIPNMIQKLQDRFDAEFNLDDKAKLAVLATVSHPQYKLLWAFDEAVQGKARSIFVEEVSEVQAEMTTSPEAPSQEVSSPSGNFLFLRPSVEPPNQAVMFLSDTRTSMEHLNAYPAVKKVFMRSNTPLCSSAPLERIFNFAGMINHPKRGRITPKNFEMCVVLKGNQVYKDGEAKAKAEQELIKKTKSKK